MEVSTDLRWILESAVFWMYLQIDKEEDAGELFEGYREESIDNDRFEYLREYLFDVNQGLFDEHLHIKEKFGRPSINEMINSLEDYKIKDDKTKDAHNINRTVGNIIAELLDLYHDLSALSHISLDALKEIEEIGNEYPYFMGYSYNNDKFDSALTKVWRVIDLMTSIFILTCSHFYGYNKPSDYLTQLRVHYFKRKVQNVKRFLNHTKRLSQMSTTNALFPETKKSEYEKKGLRKGRSASEH
jgi:hypothetical protein